MLEHAERDLTLATIAVSLARRWVLLLAACVVGAGAGLAASQLIVPRYEAEVTFLPSQFLDDGSGIGSPGLGAAVRSLGIGEIAPESDPSELIISLASTRRFLGALVDGLVVVDGDSVRVGAVLTGRIGEAAATREAELEKAANVVVVDRGQDTQLMHLRVQFPLQEAVAPLADRLIGILSDLHRELVGRVKNEEVAFISSRLAQVESDLREAENAQRRFSEQNAVTSTSPELTLELGRLQREVQLQQDLFLTLRTRYELARIEQVGGRRVISIVDQARRPEVPVVPKPAVLMALGVLVGFLAGALFVVAGLIRQTWSEAADLGSEATVS